MSTNATGTNDFYRNCGKCGTWTRVGDSCTKCGEMARLDDTVQVAPVGQYSISWPMLTEERVREIVREEIGVWMKEQEKPVSCITTTGYPGETTYTVTGLVCPWVHKQCAYVGRLGTRAGGGLFCQLEVNGGKRCPEGNMVLCKEEEGKKA